MTMLTDVARFQICDFAETFNFQLIHLVFCEQLFQVGSIWTLELFNGFLQFVPQHSLPINKRDRILFLYALPGSG
jgi:hypothetical protein